MPGDEHVPPAGPTAFDPNHPSSELLLWAYCRGIFPMADPITGAMDWFSPDPRGIIPLEDFHAPKSLRRAVRQGRFDIRSDTAFETVMRACAEPRSTENLAWIDRRLVRAYVDLHRRGLAHSVEAWLGDRLVGGLYGVHIGAAFFGESMFIRPEQGGRDASKICLVHLVDHLRQRGFRLLDTQFTNPHLEQFGCIEITREAYLARLGEAIVHHAAWLPFHTDHLVRPGQSRAPDPDGKS
jgi:leucyl/phenylalanyl-tRNA--protein transferase